MVHERFDGLTEHRRGTTSPPVKVPDTFHPASRRTSAATRSSRGAQRLSASEKEAPPGIAGVAKPVPACSTPLGVREGSAGRCSSRPGRGICGAQRLSASEKEALASMHNNVNREPRAQRLSASEKEAQLRALTQMKTY